MAAVAQQARGSFWAAPVCHPVPLGAALLMALNDHWIKGSGLLPEPVTGKLSDLLGLFFFPALLCAACWGAARLAGRTFRARLVVILAIAVTGAGFAAANLSVCFNRWLGSWWGFKQMDPSDLLTLPVLALSWLWLQRFDDDKS